MEGDGFGSGVLSNWTRDDGNSTSSRSSSAFYSCYDDNLSSAHVTPSRWQTPDKDSGIATATVLLVFMVLGVPSNLLIIVSILWKKMYKLPAHILLLNLALNDLLMCSTYIPINIVSALAGEFVFGGSDLVRCHICQTGVIFVIFAHFNLHIIALLGLDRLLFIKFPLYYHKFVNTKTTIVAVVCTWVFCILISLPPLFKFGEIKYTWSISTCSLYLLGSTDLTENIYYEVFSIAESFVLPIPILVVTNAWVVCIVRKQLNRLYRKRAVKREGKEEGRQLGLEEKLNQSRNKKQLRIAKIYGAILVSNLVTWTPNVANIVVIFALIQKPFVIPHAFFVSNYLFFLLQVVIHPLLQAWLIPDIRRTVSSLLTVCMKKRDPYRIGGRKDHFGQCGCMRCDLIGLAMLPAEAPSSMKVTRKTTATLSPTPAQSS